MDHRIRRFARIGRREFLAMSGAGVALGSLPLPARAQAKRSGEIAAGLSERMLTLDPANHYSISATSVLRHIYDPLVDVTNDLMSLVLSRTRFRVNTTLSALKGVPSWKVTPLRSVKRQVVLLTGRQDSASAGMNFESFVTSTSGS